jgi:hypothetical protein
MATNFLIPLTNSRGLRKIIFFSGLKFPIVITPSLMGEPLITSQAFYFLERLDSVARLRFESKEVTPSEREMEYIVDNYLFEYSKRHPGSKLTSKIVEYVYWQNNPDNHIFDYDWRLTECLVLDTKNDNSILDCKDPLHPTKDHFYDWCLFREYFKGAFEEYQKQLREAMSVTVTVTTQDHPSLGTGTQDLPIITAAPGILALEQVELFEVVEPGRPQAGSKVYCLSRGLPSEFDVKIEQELVTANSLYDEQLLAYYFSAIRDFSPISQFKNYYNVLEYFFEEAPAKLSVVAKTEKEQIDAVLRWAVSASDLIIRFNELPADVTSRITQARKTSSGETIPALNISSPDFIGEYASHVYTLRNACIHSKKTRKGLPTPRIAPSTEEEDILRDDIPIIQWLAIQCIEKH